MNPLSLLGMLPGWAWAVLLVVSVGHGCVATSQRDTARSDASAQRAEVARVGQAVAENKIVAAGLLADAVAEKTRLEQELAARLAKQEKDDAKQLATVAGYKAQLRAAAGATQRLRDPNAEACGGGGSGGGPSGEAAPATRAGAEDGPQTGGLFSAGATELLQRLTEEADTINAAYASCRADGYAVRGRDSSAR